MDLRAYYKRIREVEARIGQPYVVVMSLDTPDGGKAGVSAEVARPVAAKLVTEGRVRLATEEEAAAFHSGQTEARLAEEARIAAQRMQVMLVPSAETRVRTTKPRE